MDKLLLVKLGLVGLVVVGAFAVVLTHTALPDGFLVGLATVVGALVVALGIRGGTLPPASGT
jgi:hypothetical protein